MTLMRLLLTKVFEDCTYPWEVLARLVILLNRTWQMNMRAGENIWVPEDESAYIRTVGRI